MNSPAVTFEVESRFQNLRRKYVAVRVVTCAATTIAVGMLCWTLLAIGDYLWEWPLLIRRILASVTFAGLLLYGALQIWRLVVESTSSQFASHLERRFDSLGQRLRTVLQAVEGKLRAPEPMLSALGHQTLGRWETTSPASVLPMRPATLALAGCLGLLLIALAGVVRDPDWRTALLRAVGGEQAYTEMEVAPGDARLLEGSQLKLALELRGRIDRKVTLRYRGAEEESWIESDLLPKEIATEETATDESVVRRNATFEAALGKITQPIEYHFVTSAGTTSMYRVDVQPFIQVEKFEALVTPPTYTRLEPRSFNGTEITVLSGSKVEITIETNHPLAEAQLLIGDKPSTLKEVDILRHDVPTHWKFELASTASVHWQFTGKGADGTPIEPVKGRLRIRYDEEPRIEWRDPTEEIKVHMLAELPMKAQVSDDYGLSESGIVFQVGDEEEYVLKSWNQAEVEGATADSVSTQLRLEELLPLESMLLSERDFITYYAFAVDNREGSPQRVESDMRYIDIQPLRQFWAELEQDPNAAAGGGGLVPQLEEIIRRQRFLINRTRRESRNQNPDAPAADLTDQLPKIERMVESQSELADLTRFLMDFLASRGNDDTEALSQAEAAMLQAVDSLTKADFITALVQEEEAGRALTEARNSIEQIVRKNQTPAQNAQMRAFVRQMQQKLRRATPKTDKQLADTLEQIANEQKRLADDLYQSQKQMSAPESPSGSVVAGNGGGGETGDAQAGAGQADVSQVATDEAKDSEVAADDQKKAEQIKPETRQQDLVERVRAIETGLSQAIKKSSLVTKRMEESIKAMDELTGQLRNLALDESADTPTESTSANGNAISATAHEIADELRELSMHITAMSQTEPANRIAALRDMTVTLSNMENELSKTTFLAADLRDDEKAKASSPTAKTDEESKLANARTSTERMGRRLNDRSETIEDVLKTAPDLGSLQANEINDRIQKFVDDNEFLSDLAESRSAMEKTIDEKETEPWSQSASARSAEYADAAFQLDSIYRQLVMPRTDQLRKLEATANQLRRALAQQSGGKGKSDMANKDGKGGKSEEPNENAKGGSAAALMRELQNGLKASDMEDLLEMLAGSEEEKREQPDSSIDPAFQQSDSLAKPSNQFSINRSLASGVERVQKELRNRIQELIMLEIAADRDAPVPPQYRELIDGYFRTIAGGDESTMENVQ